MLCPKSIIFFTILQLVKNQEIPAFVSQVLLLGYGGNMQNLCGGVLVDGQWAATSHKCISDLFNNYKIVKVIAGWGEKYEGFKADKNATEYVQNQEHPDLALVKFDSPFALDQDIRLARLPNKNEKICDNPETRRMYVGPPKTPSQRGVILSTLLAIAAKKLLAFGIKVLVPMVLNFVAKKLWKKIRGRNLPESGHLVTATVSKLDPEACNGNHGWPVYCDNVIVGIETQCQQSGARSNEDVITFGAVSANVDFIKNTITKGDNQTVVWKVSKPEDDERKVSAKEATSGGSFLHQKYFFSGWKIVLMVLAAVNVF